MTTTNTAPATAKRTCITLHIPTGEKRADGKNRQTHIVLWNSDTYPDTFHGGVAEVVEVMRGDKKVKDLKAITKPVEVNGKVYQNPADPYVAFVNRFPSGNVSNVVVMKGGEKGKRVAELAFLNKGAKGEFASGFFNAAGLTYKDTDKVTKAGKKVQRVDDKNPANLRMTVEVRGGAKGEIYASLYSEEKAAAAKAKAAK